MEKAYFCPQCHGNRTLFGIITQAIRKVKKDPVSGEILSMTEEEPFVGMSGTPMPDVRCNSCGFVGQETMFINNATRNPRT